MNGFLLIDKKEGFTSRDVCDQISRIINERKVGHIGTLDPFATGLLIVMLGKATKTLQFFDNLTKTYEATIKLGEKTSTLDTEGEIVEAKPVPKLTKEMIEDTLKTFLGKQKQLPPMTSAIHVNGRKLYEYAHQGKEVNRPLRDIEIFDINLLSFTDNEISFRTTVSKGTYIRSLGSDIASRLNTVGYLNKLRRINIGSFDVKEAISVEEISEKSLVNIETILSKISYTKVVSEPEALDIKNGKILEMSMNIDDDNLFIIDKDNKPVAMYVRIEKGKYKFARGLF